MRKRQPLVLGSAMAAVALVAVALGYRTLFVDQGIAGATPALAQTTDETSPSGPRADRLTAKEEREAPGTMVPGNEEIEGPALRNTISKQAAEWGVKTCLGQIEQVSEFLTTGQAYFVLSRKGPASADASAFSAAIAGTDKNGLASISNFVSAPVEDGKCNSAYQTVVAFPDSCDQVHKSRFTSFSGAVEMGKAADSWTNGRGAYLHMLSLGERGCVVVKTEMVF